MLETSLAHHEAVGMISNPGRLSHQGHEGSKPQLKGRIYDCNDPFIILLKNTCNKGESIYDWRVLTTIFELADDSFCHKYRGA